MEFITITLISLGLAMDALTVSLGIGTAGQIPTLRGKLRLAAHFGIFQAGMTALGWVAGATVVQFVSEFDHWVAFALLGYVGVNLIRSGSAQTVEPLMRTHPPGKPWCSYPLPPVLMHLPLA
ncbi:MAG TPA: manganese efflux pump [Anaerolineae bacterium]|nr:manganese efflux pump [Anaerolineae bacterium]